MTEPTGMALLLGQCLGTATEPLDPEWLMAVADHMTADEITAATELGMRLRGVPEVWIELCHAETMANAITLAGKGADDQ